MSPEGIAKRITLPEDCVLGFGIPTSQEGFRASWRRGSPQSFARSFRGTAAYHAQVIAPFRRLESQFRKLGAHLVPDLTLGQYASLFQDRRTHAVILFSHWGGDFIEFRDGPVGIDAFIQAIPADFAVILDLCVCHPVDLISPLRASRPYCLIPYIGTRATPVYWLYFYRDLFRCLRNGSRSYLSASMELVAGYSGTPLEVQT
ncbi:MAG TPA: hypothetical protein VN493_10940 [Thermoanaerobaculia bacterium]|nr:hypothetical protein [Thermoanaerobaculia bacterium]